MNVTFRIVALAMLILGLFSLTSDQTVSAQSFNCTDMIEIPQIECEALVAFYNSTNGAGWTDRTNWLETNTPSNWYGVTVVNGHVTQLNIVFNNLTGSMPSELGNLTGLARLYIYNNQNLTGNIPPELGSLTGLQRLYLYNNHLTGSIPPELGSLINLEYI